MTKDRKPDAGGDYHWPPKRMPRPERPGRHPVHAVVTALPLLLLLIGLVFHYSGESRQSTAEPITAESRTLVGEVVGLSVIGAGSGAQHYFWLQTAAGERGIRLTARQHAELVGVAAGSEVLVNAAPTVSGSATLWALDVQRGDERIAVRQ